MFVFFPQDYSAIVIACCAVSVFDNGGMVFLFKHRGVVPLCCHRGDGCISSIRNTSISMAEEFQHIKDMPVSISH